MTKKIQTPNIEETHVTKTSVDQLANELANQVVVEGITPLSALTRRAQQDILAPEMQIFLSGSSFMAAAANPLHFLVQKFVRVFFGLNEGLMMGSAYHKALDLANAHYIEHGNYPRFGKAFAASIKYINENFSKMKDEEEITKEELTRYVLKMLKVYWFQQLPLNKPVASEVFVSMPTPEYMLRNAENALKILLTGAADVIYEVEGELVLSDHKTAKRPIKGKIEKNKKLEELEEEIKTLEKENILLSKTLKKFANAKEKLAEAKSQRDEVAIALMDARENKKSTTQIEKRLTKWSGETEKWEENLGEFETAYARTKEIEAKLVELDELTLPLIVEQDEAQKEADLKECKKKHGQQLAFYAMLYMIIFGQDVRRVRIENMVKAKVPELQVFEWELDDMVLAKAEEQIRANITKIELMLEGIDPLVLFPQNTMAFIGSETNKLVEDIEDIAELLKVDLGGKIGK